MDAKKILGWSDKLHSDMTATMSDARSLIDSCPIEIDDNLDWDDSDNDIDTEKSKEVNYEIIDPDQLPSFDDIETPDFDWGRFNPV